MRGYLGLEHATVVPRRRRTLYICCCYCCYCYLSPVVYPLVSCPCSFSFFDQHHDTADAKKILDSANKELSKAQSERKLSDATLVKLSKEYDATQKALSTSQSNLKKAQVTYKKYLEKTARKAKQDAENKKKAAQAARKRQAEQAKKDAETKKKAEQKKVEQAKKAAQAQKKAEEKARKKRQDEAAKAAKKAKGAAAKAAKIKAEKIKKTQASIESLEKEKRDLVIKDAPMVKVTATENKIKEAKSELTVLLKSK